MEKLCENCRWTDTSIQEFPCYACNSFLKNKWEPAVGLKDRPAIEEEPVENCSTCVYDDRDVGEMPCSGCFDMSRWFPAQGETPHLGLTTEQEDSAIVEEEGQPVLGSFEYQEGGGHYQKFSIQPAEFIIKNDIPGAEASIIRYVCRHADKNGIQDLRKAHQYLEMLAEIKYDTVL